MKVELSSSGAVVSVIEQVAPSTDAIKIALAAFLEGRQLEGAWRLKITGAELVQDEPPT